MKNSVKSLKNQPKIIIIGAGFGGINAGIQLKTIGWENFEIIEKNP